MNFQSRHLQWQILPLFRPGGKVFQKVMVKDTRNAYEQHGVHAGTFEHLVHVALVTGNLAGKPLHLAALAFQFRGYHPSDVQSLYLLFFRHEKIRELLLILRFWTTYTPNKKAHGNPQAFQLSCRCYEIVQISVSQRKAKTLYVNMLFIPMLYICFFVLIGYQRDRMLSIHAVFIALFFSKNASA